MSTYLSYDSFCFQKKQTSAQIDMEKVLQPFLKQNGKSFTYKHSPTGRPYRVCSCCGKIQFLDDTKNQHNYHHHQHSNHQQSSSQNQKNFNSTQSQFQFLQDVVDQTLQKYYDEIDKFLTKWSKKQKQKQGTLFIEVIKKLSQIFVNFQNDLAILLQIKLKHSEIIVTNSNYHCYICERLKDYSISNFPILKDFINNFSLEFLDQKQSKFVMGLSQEYCLIHKIIEDLKERQQKKNSKKKKKEKTPASNTKIQQNNPRIDIKNKSKQKQKLDIKKIYKVEHLDQIYSETINNLLKMKISKEERTFCYTFNPDLEITKKNKNATKKQQIINKQQQD